MVPVPGSDRVQATVDDEPAEVVRLEAFGWPYALVTVPLSPSQVETKQVVVGKKNAD